jgi:large subunit ribosomal protein L35
MPKMKTRRAAKKRFKITASGKISHKNSFSRHNMEHKSRKRKRAFRKDQQLSENDHQEVKRMLGMR